MKTSHIDAMVFSPGQARGKVFFIEAGQEPSNSAEGTPVDVQQELHRFQNALQSTVVDLTQLIEQLEHGNEKEQAEITRAHIALLQDSQFHENVRKKIEMHGYGSEHAIEEIALEFSLLSEESGNELIAARSTDLMDMGQRLKRALRGESQDVFGALSPTEDHVAVVAELLPSHVFAARDHRVTGFIFSKGTPLAHASILARLYEIPVLKVTSLSPIKAGAPLILDGNNRRVVTNPGRSDIDSIVSERPASRDAGDFTELPWDLWLNIIDPQQLDSGMISKTSGIGLYRTEILFMTRHEDFPSEEEQFLTYRALFDRCGDKPVTIRTLDIGGDKFLPYFSLGPQANPYLGLRAHRIYRFHPEIVVRQVRAILRAAGHNGRLRLLYPMIESEESLFFVQSLVMKAVASLQQERRPVPQRFEEGVLIEVPSALWDYPRLLQNVDFASLGTNDLFQYFFSADRNNPNVSAYCQPENPVALRMLDWVVRKSNQANKPLSICGEIATDPAYLPLLVGLGLKHFSIGPSQVHRIHALLSGLDLDHCRQLARKAIDVHSGKEVRQLLLDFGGISPLPTDDGSSGEGDRIDPICGMIVHVNENTLSVVREGKSIYFCSQKCRQEYMSQIRQA
ncbi:phosphoenolpyruvate--protein phosphotransferase [bacterium]|nr:phosphoenolpyruvate--protein phosphotransferase [bacterium]